MSFPQFTKNQQKILVEFQDCIIQALDLIDFQIIMDDNKWRADKLKAFDQELLQSLNMVRGNKVNSNPEALKTYQNVFGDSNVL